MDLATAKARRKTRDRFTNAASHVDGENNLPRKPPRNICTILLAALRPGHVRPTPIIASPMRRDPADDERPPGSRPARRSLGTQSCKGSGEAHTAAFPCGWATCPARAGSDPRPSERRPRTGHPDPLAPPRTREPRGEDRRALRLRIETVAYRRPRRACSSASIAWNTSSPGISSAVPFSASCNLF